MSRGLTARTHRGDVLVFGSGTVMEACLAAALPVASSCLGRGACGKCLMTVLDGGDALCAPSDRERQVLMRNQAGATERLGCQCPMPRTSGRVVLTTGYW